MKKFALLMVFVLVLSVGFVVGEKTDAEILDDLEQVVLTRGGASNFLNKNETDFNFDFNDDGMISGTDFVILRDIHILDTGTFKKVYNKIMDAVKEREGLGIGEIDNLRKGSYIAEFDINRDGGIDLKENFRIRYVLIGERVYTMKDEVIMDSFLKMVFMDHYSNFLQEEIETNFDFNDDGMISGTDFVILRDIHILDTGTFKKVYNKMMSAVAGRIGLTKGKTDYIRELDINNDGVINSVDSQKISEVLIGDRVVEEVTEPSILDGLTSLVRAHQTGPFNMNDTIANFDFNEDGLTNANDVIRMRDVQTGEDSDFAVVYDKIVAEVNLRMGSRDSEDNYFVEFDVDSDGEITGSDLSVIKAALCGSRVSGVCVVEEEDSLFEVALSDTRNSIEDYDFSYYNEEEQDEDDLNEGNAILMLSENEVPLMTRMKEIRFGDSSYRHKAGVFKFERKLTLSEQKVFADLFYNYFKEDACVYISIKEDVGLYLRLYERDQNIKGLKEKYSRSVYSSEGPEFYGFILCSSESGTQSSSGGGGGSSSGGSTTTEPETSNPVEGDDGVKTCPDSCLLNEKCYPYGFRKGAKYCSDVSDEFVEQKVGGSCDNDFECESNSCLDSQCVEAGWWTRFMNWFARLFGF